MAAFVKVKLRFRGAPARVPDRVPILNIVIMAVGILGDVIITVTGQTQELRVPVEAVAAAGVADQGKEVLAAEIVDPGQGSFGRGDDILPRFVVKMAEFHSFPPLKHRNETGRRKRFS